jgi:hypothetical protein
MVAFAGFLNGCGIFAEGLRSQRVNGGVRISSDSHPDAVAKFKKLASGPAVYRRQT